MQIGIGSPRHADLDPGGVAYVRGKLPGNGCTVYHRGESVEYSVEDSDRVNGAKPVCHDDD